MGSTPPPPPLTPNIYYTSPQSSIKIDRNLAEGVFGVGPAETGLKVVYYNAHRISMAPFDDELYTLLSYETRSPPESVVLKPTTRRRRSEPTLTSSAAHSLFGIR